MSSIWVLENPLTHRHPRLFLIIFATIGVGGILRRLGLAWLGLGLHVLLIVLRYMYYKNYIGDFYINNNLGQLLKVEVILVLMK